MRTLRDLVEDHYSAAARGQTASMFVDFAPDITWRESPGSRFSGTFTGAEEIAENVFTRLGSHFEQFAFVPLSYVCEAEVVAVIGEYRAATAGREITIVPTVHVWRGSAAAITSFEQFTDTSLLNSA
jgi:ketosteroid isomerase-like protein